VPWEDADLVLNGKGNKTSISWSLMLLIESLPTNCFKTYYLIQQLKNNHQLWFLLQWNYYQWLKHEYHKRTTPCEDTSLGLQTHAALKFLLYTHSVIKATFYSIHENNIEIACMITAAQSSLVKLHCKTKSLETSSRTPRSRKQETTCRKQTALTLKLSEVT